MIVSTKFLTDCFNRFNAEIFGGSLPPIPIRTARTKTSLGRFHYVKKKSLLGRDRYEQMSLSFSTLFDLSEREWEDTVIHEMIHYYLAVTDAPKETAHGPHFRAEMERINRDYGRNITISHKRNKENPGELTDNRRRTHIVAVMRMKNGTTGLKCLVCVGRKVLDYYRTVTAVSTVESVEIYATQAPYFNRFPHSVSMRYHVVDAAELRSHLSGAVPLVFDGHRFNAGQAMP